MVRRRLRAALLGNGIRSGCVASQLPPVARRVLAEHDSRPASTDDRALESRLLKPLLETPQFVPNLDCDVRPGRRTVIGILAQVYLLAILALEPPGYPGQLRWWHDPSVSEYLEKKGFLGLRPSNRHPKVDVMKAQHARSVLRRHVPRPEVLIRIR